MPEVRLGVYGAAGRLGARIVELSSSWPGVRVTVALERAGAPCVGQAVPGGPDGLRVVADGSALDGCDVLVDASMGEAVAGHARDAARARVPLLVAVTALTPASQEEVARASAVVPVCVAPNLSTGVWVLAHLAHLAAGSLPGFDVEIVEAHHRGKKDAPSGTALLLGRAVAAARQVKLDDCVALSRAGTPAARVTGSVGIGSVRGGDVVGEHTVFVLGDGERLELTHRAHSRDTFARGALTLAPRLVGRPAGMVSVPQLLELASW
jgi:4-hydroxy-tetrahydrodipicolinate reductase